MIRQDITQAKSTESGSSDQSSSTSHDGGNDDASNDILETDAANKKPISLIEDFVGRATRERNQIVGTTSESGTRNYVIPKDKQKLLNKIGGPADGFSRVPVSSAGGTQDTTKPEFMLDKNPRPIHNIDHRIVPQRQLAEQSLIETQEQPVPLNPKNDVKGTSGIVQSAFDRMRPKRNAAEVATITIGSNVTTAILGSTPAKRRRIIVSALDDSTRESTKGELSQRVFSNSVRTFAAPGTQSPRFIDEQSDATYPLRLADLEDDISSLRDESSETDRLGVAGDSNQDVETGADDDTDVPKGRLLSSLESTSDEANSDGEVLDEQQKKSRENAKVAELIARAEEKTATPSEGTTRRAQKLLRRSGYKDATTQLKQNIRYSINQIDLQVQNLEALIHQSQPSQCIVEPATFADGDSAEARLSLTVGKEDFSRMRIVGQFNLGFILAFRPSKLLGNDSIVSAVDDELFIIDQHASDEKFNFERLQSSTVVQNQPLVRPYTLNLTAIEEEIIFENNDVLLKNGFVVTIDTSGDEPVGRRCKLLSLPMSREVIFDMADLEELIALLAEWPSRLTTTIEYPSNTPTKMDINSVPRPSKVRRMFAMRACRSSVMIGKSLSKAQMEKLVRHMGEIDKPWNCPHGRPTMRHVLGLGPWEGWREGMGNEGSETQIQEEVDWNGWFKRMKKLQDAEMDRHTQINTDVENKEAEGGDESSEESTEEELDGFGGENHVEDRCQSERNSMGDWVCLRSSPKD